MPKISEKEFGAQIKSGDFKSAYLIYGDETYLKEYYVSHLKKKLVDKTFEAFNYHSFYGTDVELSEIIKDAQMLPMMSEYNFVLVRDYPVEKTENDIELIEEYLSDPCESTVLVVWYDALAPNTDKFKKLVKIFNKYAYSVECAKKGEQDLIKMLISSAKKRGSVLDKNNASYLISISGSDIKTLINEVDKMSNYVGSGEITKQVIDDMAVKCLQARVFDLSKALVAGNGNKAYEVLDTLFSLNENSTSIVAAIGNAYVDMYRVKCAKTYADSPQDIANYYNYHNREFVIKNATRDSAKLTFEQLRTSLDDIAQTDLKLKSTAVDAKLLIEELMVKLLINARGNNYA